VQHPAFDLAAIPPGVHARSWFMARSPNLAFP
jgi:hypothetical protein